MDLSPRDVVPVRPRAKKRWPAYLLLGLVVAAGGVVVTKFLTSAVDYFCNADEIGTKEDCSGDKRIRVQGTVERDSLQTDVVGADLTFDISFNGVTIPVAYTGSSPGGIFKECIPVVVAGRMQAGVFQGDQIQVKHSNEYDKENPDRAAAAADSVAACPVAG